MVLVMAETPSDLADRPPRLPSATTGLAGAALGQGSADARAALFERILARVHRYFARVTGDPDAAEELTQETLLVLERTLREARYDPARSFNTWIFLKAHQVLVGWLRRRELERRVRPGDLPAAAPPDDPARAVERRLDGAALLAAVREELGEDTLETFVLRYEGGLSLEQVAQATGCERRTVSRRLERAHALLDRLLGRDGRAAAGPGAGP